MNILTQEAKKRQAVVECAIKNDNKSYAGRKYGYSLSSVKRWCNLYDGTWQSLVEKSHRPHSHPKRHTKQEERKIKKAFKKCFGIYLQSKRYEPGFRKMDGGKLWTERKRNL